ncbi:MAG: thiamine-phosphate kinase [Planctomycetota bacterium]
MEHGFIAWAKARAARLPQIRLGIGDDCALIAPTATDWVVTTDSLCEGTHFLLSECGPRAVGRKLDAVNLSDLASMAAAPIAVFLSLCLPRLSAGEIASEVFEGVCESCEQYSVAIGGGDTNVWDGDLVVHLTAIGSAPVGGAWLRQGAQPGDAIFVTGSLGGSILGKHLNFEPRLSLARALHPLGVVRAATDISDGLGIDLLNVTVASRCGAELELDRVPISEAAHRRSTQTGRPAIEHALGDGEDFELLLAVAGDAVDRVPSHIEGVPLTRIGTFVSRTGLWTKTKRGVEQLPPRGYVHG